MFAVAVSLAWPLLLVGHGRRRQRTLRRSQGREEHADIRHHVAERSVTVATSGMVKSVLTVALWPVPDVIAMRSPSSPPCW